jgi:uncharacterized protein DUF4062
MAIRTPDQRLRVFVSSTLGELAAERRAVSRAIAALRLAPVMFELGARPHPPQELYRAYLEQSDVFIGLYWQSYGWIGPGMQVSGLEDEFNLARGLPQLLYIKTPARDREPRLTSLLDRIRAEGTVSYRAFGTPAELGRLVRDDLAMLLSERFADRTPGPPASVRGPRPLPASTTSLVGREHDVDEVVSLAERPEVRLVTLTGPGGIGKTRLAVAAAQRMRDHFPGRTAFVPLAAVSDLGLLLASIGQSVGSDLTGTRSPAEALGPPGSPGFRPDHGQRRRGGGDLPAAGRRAAGDRAGRRPYPAAGSGCAAGPPGQVDGRAGHRAGGHARAPAHAASHRGVERGPTR